MYHRSFTVVKAIVVPQLLLICWVLNASAFGDVTCQTMSGDWGLGFGGWAATTITQGVSGNLSVTMTATPCGSGVGPCTYTGTGTLSLSTAAFTFTVTTSDPTLVEVSPSFYEIFPLTQTFSGTLESGGCNLAQQNYYFEVSSPDCISWVESHPGYTEDMANSICASYEDDGVYAATKTCDTPSGSPPETTASTDHWEETAGAAWNQTLQPTSFNFGGRYVTEESPGDGTDSCWFPLSEVDPYVRISSGTWNVDATNLWGSDYVGWTKAAVTYYRSQSVTPCGSSFQQKMYIDCNEGPSNYITNDLGSDITSTSVSSIRAGSTVYNYSW